MKMIFVLSAVLLFVCAAHSARSVSVSLPDGQLFLTNPTAAPVTYDVQCYDKVTGSTIIDQTSQSLAAKAGVKISNPAGCASGVTAARTLPQGPLFCNGNVTYANRGTLCSGTATAPCTIQKIESLALTSADMNYGYWISIDAASTPTWWYSYDNFSTKNMAYDTSADMAPISANKNGSYACSTLTNGGGSKIMGVCYATTATNTQSGTMCCPTNNGFVSCKVTITSASGHLQSPQFKGGSPF